MLKQKRQTKLSNTIEFYNNMLLKITQVVAVEPMFDKVNYQCER